MFKLFCCCGDETKEEEIKFRPSKMTYVADNEVKAFGS